MAWDVPHYLGGPVLHWELLRAWRRPGFHVLRYGYLAFIVFQFLVMSANLAAAERESLQRYNAMLPQEQKYALIMDRQAFALDYLALLLEQQLVLIVFLTPAVTGGALAQEKERGTLAALLGTELSAWEIVIGKLLGRLAVLAQIALVPLPLITILAIYAGMGGVRLLVAILQPAVLTVALAAASLLCSVWTRQTRDAILACYASVTLVYLASLTALGNQSLPLWLNPLEGLRLLFTSASPPWSSFLVALVVWTTVAALCLFFAVTHLRKAWLRLEGRQPARWLWAVRPRIGNRPVRWREQHVIGLAPLPWLRMVPTWMGRLGVFAFSAILVFSALRDLTGRTLVPLFLSGDFGILWEKLARLRHPGLGHDRLENEVIVMGVVLGVIGSLVVGVRSATSVREEKRRKTWEDLVLTSLSFSEIVEQKRNGILRATLPCLAMYMVPMLALSALGGGDLVFRAVIFVGFALFAIFLAAVVGAAITESGQEERDKRDSPPTSQEAENWGP